VPVQENKGLLGVFLGYCNNIYAYKIFDITNDKVIISRTVDFYEKNFPLIFILTKTSPI